MSPYYVVQRTYMNCRYCTIIHQHDAHYRVRRAGWDITGSFPRCAWHWQFVCDRCGRNVSFNGMAWCRKTEDYLCIRCAPRHKKVSRRFWAWDYYYALWCTACRQYHSVLDFAEYAGKHPWQKDRQALRVQKGLYRGKTLKPMVYIGKAPERLQHPSRREIQRRWDRGADIWDAGYTKYGDRYRRVIFNPALFKLIGDVRGKRVFDAGCGTGYLCRLLAERGARVTGIDLSKRFIEIAREYEKKKSMGIRYHHGDLSQIPQVKTGSFDLVVSVYVLCDVRDYERAIGEIARVLRSRGRFIMLIEHPCFSWGAGGWEHVPLDSQRTEDRRFFKVDNYFQRRTEECQWGTLPVLLSFYRPLSDYFHALRKCKFTVVDLFEPRPKREALRMRPREWTSEDRVPPVLIIDAVKTT